MTIKSKINISFGIIISIIVISCVLILLQLRGIDQNYRMTLDEGLPQIKMTENIEKEIILIGSHIQTYLLGNRDSLAELETSRDNVAQYIGELRNMLPSEEDQETISQLESKVSTFYDKIDRAVQMVAQGAQRGSGSFYATNVAPTRDDVVATSSELTKKINESFEQAQDDAKKKSKFAIIAAAIIIVIAVLIGIALSRYMYQSIAKPVYKLRNSVRVIAEGDLTAEDVEIHSHDELGDLSASFNEMKKTLKRMITSLASNAEHLNATAEELSASTQEVTTSSMNIAHQSEESVQNATRAAAAAKEGAQAMEETAIAINKIAEATQQLHTKAISTENLAAQGKINVDSASEQMATIYESTKLTTKLIQKLSAQSEEIEGISKIITGITEQTNLLALNAAIEAARAGENGKGFAVVADEVRKLAEQSKQSANQIVQLTSEIQLDTKNVELAVNRSLSTVEAGVSIIEEAGQSFHQIVEAVDYMKDQIENISAVSEEISAASEEVAAAVSDISSNADVTMIQMQEAANDVQTQVTTLQEIAAVSTDLSGRANDLQEIVNHFKL